MQNPAAPSKHVANHIEGSCNPQNKAINTVAKAIQSTQTRGPRPPKKRSVAQPAVNIPKIPEISKAATIQPAC